MDYHADVCSTLKNLDCTQLTELGGALGISYPKLRKMKDKDLLHELVAAWINRQDEVLKKSGEPTWNELMGKLKQIKQAGIAEDIRRKYAGNEQPENCNADHSNSSLSSELDPKTISLSLIHI